MQDITTSKKNVLIVSTNGLGMEGITSVIRNYSSHILCDDLQLHFVALERNPPQMIEEFKKLGTVHILPNRGNAAVKYFAALWRILRQNIQVAHIHGSSGTICLEVLCARLAGVHKIITHCHSTSCKNLLAHKLMRFPLPWLSSHRIACSEAAGKWLYGNHDYQVMNNAIDIYKYQFQAESRNTIRQEFHIHDAYVLGHVGYFATAKNQSFLLDVFHILHTMEPNSKLILVGDGADREAIEQKIAALGIQNDVILTGRRTDVARLYSAMDIFVMPSLWEGLPVSLLEAQANGLPILASDTITTDVKCSDRLFFASLDDGPEKWAKKVLEIQQQNFDREAAMAPFIRQKGFDISTQAESLKQIYLSE